MSRKPYPSNVSDEVLALMLPYLQFQKDDDPRRKYSIRDIINAMMWIIRTGSQWEYLPHDFPPYKVVHRQVMFWFERHCFENMLHDLRILSRRAHQKNDQPTVVIMDSKTLKSTPESGHRAGYDGAKKTNGSKIHALVDTLGNLLTLLCTPADEQDRERVYELCQKAQEITNGNVEVACADSGYTGEQAEIDANINDVELAIIKRSDDAEGFEILPKRWIVERTFGWFSRFRRLGRDLERLATTLCGFHYLAACILLLNKTDVVLGSLAG